MKIESTKPLCALCVEEFKELIRELLYENNQGQQESNIPEPTDETMNIAACAEFLHCSKVSVHAYKKHGLPFYRIGRKVLFRKNEVMEFMKQRLYTGRRISTIRRSKKHSDHE